MEILLYLHLPKQPLGASIFLTDVFGKMSTFSGQTHTRFLYSDTQIHFDSVKHQVDMWPIPSVHLPLPSGSLQSQVCVVPPQSEQTNNSHQSCQHHNGTASKHVSGTTATLPSSCS